MHAFPSLVSNVCVCSYVDNILVALQDGVECVEVSLSVSSSLPQCLDLLLHALLFLSHFGPQSLQGSLQITKHVTSTFETKKKVDFHVI